MEDSTDTSDVREQACREQREFRQKYVRAASDILGDFQYSLPHISISQNG